MRVVVLQHVGFEGPAGLADALRAVGGEVSVTQVGAGEPLPPATGLDWLVVMGGPMSVHDEARHPWLAPEKALIRRCLDADRRVLGVCLGAQLVAEALGARVVPAAEREIGWLPVTRAPGAEASPFGRALPPRFTAFHWHGERFELPRGAVHLARSEACAEQAFAAGSRVLGLQFHLETTPDAARALVEHGAAELATPGPYVQTRDEILAPNAPWAEIAGVLSALIAVLAAG